MFKSLNRFPPRQLFLLIAGPFMASVLAICPAWSLDSGWAETEGGRMRLVIDPAPRQDGTIGGILDIDLDPGWKTYWRDPGSAGIPPMLDVSASRNIDLDAMHYPPPVRVDDGYAIWAGYTAPIRFPLTFRRTGSGKAVLRALAFVGICEKICVPFQAEFTIDLPEGSVSDDQARIMIADAFARLPETPGPDFELKTASFDAGSKQLEISASLPGFRPAGATPQLFVAGPQGFAFAQPEIVSDENGLAKWIVRIEDLPNLAPDSTGENINVVVTFGQRAVEQNVPTGRVPEN
ncbi:protein involved in C-type cytochrome biogenesis [Hoeflea sp. IMCC20628]|uniref:protein-disulfide reductase DsbD domain-containing protein n=1 Tax=Hoeflea sp. IMCC20628 TaxID=1620421 RepID=UPI00063BDBEE|nr:protein-disulfide reductase DsbD domain-containing protein [Hoeflea sp. IMCC20628]AKI01474.1 protein involved in C-type cytochrome biogenesis [Hoeflea sp. IMCC20628]